MLLIVVEWRGLDCWHKIVDQAQTPHLIKDLMHNRTMFLAKGLDAQVYGGVTYMFWKNNTHESRLSWEILQKVVKTAQFVFVASYRILWKRGVLQMALQLNFWITKVTCNSLYLYVASVNKQVAGVANCNSLYICCNSLQLNYNLIKTIHFQLLFNFVITTPMMSCWCH